MTDQGQHRIPSPPGTVPAAVSCTILLHDITATNRTGRRAAFGIDGLLRRVCLQFLQIMQNEQAFSDLLWSLYKFADAGWFKAEVLPTSAMTQPLRNIRLSANRNRSN